MLFFKGIPFPFIPKTRTRIAARIRATSRAWVHVNPKRRRFPLLSVLFSLPREITLRATVASALNHGCVSNKIGSTPKQRLGPFWCPLYLGHHKGTAKKRFLVVSLWFYVGCPLKNPRPKGDRASEQHPSRRVESL